jgi:hypothetical protein
MSDLRQKAVIIPLNMPDEPLRVRSGIHERRPNRRTRSMTEAA